MNGEKVIKMMENVFTYTSRKLAFLNIKIMVNE